MLALGAGLVAAIVPRSEAPAAPPSNVQQIYLRDCATCHGARGEGTDDGPSLEHSGPALADYMLTTGRMPLAHPDDEMVRHDPRYDAATIAALVAYVASLHPDAGQPIPEVDVASANLARGGEDFRLACAACHQAVGQGGALRYGEAPSLMRSTPVQVVEAMRTGPGTMPVFAEDAFSDDEVAGIAAYIQYLQDPEDRGGQPLWHFGPLAEGLIAFLAVVFLTGALVVIGERR